MADDEWESVDFTKLRIGVRGTKSDVYMKSTDQDSGRTAAKPSSSSSSEIPGGSMASPATLAAVATVEHDIPIDPALTAALDNPRERVNALKFEDKILQFLKGGSKQIDFPSLSSYHRLIIHRLAQRFGLEHVAVDATASGSNFDNPNINKTIVLLKTPQTCAPRVLLIDLCKSDDTSSSNHSKSAAPTMKLMRRSDPTRDSRRKGGGANNTSSLSSQATTKTVSEREREYAEARARIFGTSKEEEETDKFIGAANSSATTTTTTTTKGPRISQAQGPDGTAGFGAGRGKATGVKALSSNESLGAERRGKGREEEEKEKEEEEERFEEDEGGGLRNGSKPVVVNPGDWVESKVLWRNRQAELSDPDFVRHHRGAAHGGLPLPSLPPGAYPPPPPPAQAYYHPPPYHILPPPALHYVEPNYQTPAPPYYQQNPPYMHAQYVDPRYDPAHNSNNNYFAARPPPPRPRSPYDNNRGQTPPGRGGEYYNEFPPLG